MKPLLGVWGALILVFAGTMRSGARDGSTVQIIRPLVLTEAIPLEGSRDASIILRPAGKDCLCRPWLITRLR